METSERKPSLKSPDVNMSTHDADDGALLAERLGHVDVQVPVVAQSPPWSSSATGVVQVAPPTMSAAPTMNAMNAPAPFDVRGVLPTLTFDGARLEEAFLALHYRLASVESNQVALMTAAAKASQTSVEVVDDENVKEDQEELRIQLAEDKLLDATYPLSPSLSAIAIDTNNAPSDSNSVTMPSVRLSASLAEGGEISNSTLGQTTDPSIEGIDPFSMTRSAERENAKLKSHIDRVTRQLDTALKRLARREKLQLEKDAAQDAMRQMEITRLSMQLASKVSPHDLDQVIKQAANRSTFLADELQEKLTVGVREVQSALEGQLGSVMQVVNTISARIDGLSSSMDGIKIDKGDLKRLTSFDSSSVIAAATAAATATAQELILEASESTKIMVYGMGRRIQEQIEEQVNQTTSFEEQFNTMLRLKMGDEHIPDEATGKVAALLALEAQLKKQTEVSEASSTTFSGDLVNIQLKSQDMQRKLHRLDEELSNLSAQLEARVIAIKQDLGSKEQSLDSLTMAQAATERRTVMLGEAIEVAKSFAAESAREAQDAAIRHTGVVASGLENRLRTEAQLEAEATQASALQLSIRVAKCEDTLSTNKTLADISDSQTKERFEIAETHLVELDEGVATINASLVTKAAELASIIEEEKQARHRLAQMLQLSLDEETRLRSEADTSIRDQIKVGDERTTALNSSLDAARRDTIVQVNALKAEVQEALQAQLPPGSSNAAAVLPKGVKQTAPPLAVLGKMLGAHLSAKNEAIEALQKSGLNITMLVRRLEHTVQGVATKGMFWEAYDAKLQAHVEEVMRVSLSAESSAMSRAALGPTGPGPTAPILPMLPEVQRLLAGNMQRVSKLLASKADYEVIRLITKSEHPQAEAYDWDKRVAELRDVYLTKFLRDTRELIAKTAPHPSPFAEAARGRLAQKIEDSLKIALSKHRLITPGTTLFGKIRIQPVACMACDRPFLPEGEGKIPKGNDAAAGPPPPNAKSRDMFRPRTSQGRLGGPGSNSLARSSSAEWEGGGMGQGSLISGPSMLSIGGGMGIDGGPSVVSQSASTNTQFVYRSGFKFPKHSRAGVIIPLPGINPLDNTLESNNSARQGSTPQKQKRPQSAAVELNVFQPNFPPDLLPPSDRVRQIEYSGSISNNNNNRMQHSGPYYAGGSVSGHEDPEFTGSGA